MKTNWLLALTLIAPLALLSVPASFGAGGDSGSTSSSGSTNSNYDKYFKRAQTAEKKKRYEDAVKYYQQALKAKPRDADALNGLGFSLRSIGKTYMMEAAKAYEDALKADPNHDGALEYQGELFLWMGELGKANANLKKLERMKSPEAKELAEELEAILAQARKLL